MDTEMKMDNKPENPVKQEKPHVILKASGDLCLKFYEMQTGVWNVAAFTEGLTYQLNNVTPAYAKALEFPFAFRMNAGGNRRGNCGICTKVCLRILQNLNDIAPYFSSSDESVRVSAYDAIRRMDDPEATDMLAKSVKTEESPKVREKAFATLASMPPTSAGVKLAKTTVFTVENSKEQEPMVKVLGKNLKTYPQNEQVLRDLLQKDPDNRVKKEIYKYIVPK